MSFFVSTTESGYQLMTAGYVAAAVILIALIVLATVLAKKEKKEKKKPGKVRKIARWSIAVAVFGVLLAALIVGYFTGYL